MLKTHRLVLLTLSLLVSGYLTAAEKTESLEVSVMTFNIRNGRANDGENRWDLRKEFVCDVIRRHAPDAIGVQEAFRFQLDVFKKLLPDYGEVGIGRDGGTRGEYSAILYSKKRFTVDESGTFWLSDTPEKPSASWGNRYRRVCTWARLVEKETSKAFYVFNTHLDHQSQKSRENSVKLIIKRIVGRKHSDPFVLMGDFNAAEDNPAVIYLKGTGKQTDKTPIPVIDTFRAVHPKEKVVGTFSHFNGYTKGAKIDYIFVTKNTHTLKAGIDRVSRKGRNPSDHYPVTARVRF